VPNKQFFRGIEIKRKKIFMAAIDRNRKRLRQNALFSFSRRLYIENSRKSRIKTIKDTSPATTQILTPLN